MSVGSLSTKECCRLRNPSTEDAAQGAMGVPQQCSFKGLSLGFSIRQIRVIHAECSAPLQEPVGGAQQKRKQLNIFAFAARRPEV
jgi:hypothetical protein